jgi:hypothetical protein
MSHKDSFWFKHDSNARNDVKIVSLRMRCGWEGYGVFFAFIECLRDAKYNRIPESEIDPLLFDMRIERSVFDAIVEIGLLKIATGYVFSDSLNARMKGWNSLTKKRRESGKLGGSKPKSKATCKQPESKQQANSKQTASDLIGSEEKRREEKIEYPYCPEAYRLAVLLMEAIRKWKKDAKTPDSLKAWEADIDRMIRLDNRTPAQIEAVLQWLPTDDFWPPNILSGAKLRKQFDKLEVKMVQRRPQQQPINLDPFAGKPRLDNGEDPTLRPRPNWGIQNG